jgi:hypothetical protein
LGYRLWERFKEYVRKSLGNDIADSLDIPGAEITQYMRNWIFLECDIPDPKNNKRMMCKNLTYSQALKMRAAISFHYNQLGRGSNSWEQGKDGNWFGNPSLSHDIRVYMLSLQRRKVSILHHD